MERPFRAFSRRTVPSKRRRQCKSSNAFTLVILVESNLNVTSIRVYSTGAWTNSALGYATGNNDQFLFNARCILSYMAGSAIAAILSPNPSAFEIPSTVSPTFLVGAALLYWSSKMAGTEDGESFIYLAAIANGIQNSVTSAITGNLVRSAHFSGITSDIGTFLGQVLRGNKQNLMKLKVFCLLGASFWTGGVVSYSVTKEYATTSLLFSAALYVAIALGLFMA